MTQPLVTDLKGVGARVAERLAQLGLFKQSDLLFHLPLRYEDKTQITPLSAVRAGTWAQVEGVVIHQSIRYARSRMLVATLADDTGQILLRYFRFYPSQQRQLQEGARVRCFGEVRLTNSGLEMAHPQTQTVSGSGLALSDHLTAIYPTTQGVSQALITRLVDQVLERLLRGELDLPDYLLDLEAPRAIGHGGVNSLQEALLSIHRPKRFHDIQALLEGKHPAVERLVREELLAHHLTVTRQNAARAQHTAPILSDQAPTTSDYLTRFRAGLGFAPTTAQERVIREIADDMGQSKPMRRLLQGDVGSGKTVVAGAALLMAAGATKQGAIIAPTELLAEQHHRTLTQWFEPLGVEVVWLSGKVTGRARTRALERIAEGASVVVGTHAVFQDPVEFKHLALVVVDEQHRFGVHQRLALANKGRRDNDCPHQLVMTATPIPRTLAMTAYAGLDVSVIDVLPPGRQPVTTVAMSQVRREEVIERLSAVLAEGRQAYWVCPLIEESEVLEAEAAETRAEELTKALPQFQVALIHGRMKAQEKQDIMALFLSGDIQLLVATTVIEVGVDVPNASLMMIENAERMGLSQLHQLRGRVGRGQNQSACVLLYKAPLGEMAKQRLQVMRETTDGFVIAEKDLELRGPGEVLGTRQTGLMRFRIAELSRDAHLLEDLPNWANKLSPQAQAGLIDRWVGQAEAYIEV